MKSNIKAYLITLTLLLVTSTNLLAQENYRFSQQYVGNGKDSTRFVAPFSFVNIGITEYFVEAKKLKEIQRLEKDGDLEGLKSALEKYISYFGAENFGQDYELMWKLAQLYEQFGQEANAKWMYRILLRHTDENIENIALYYDNLTVNEKPYYVPIKYYYELVDYRKQVDTLRPPQGVFINMGDSVNSKFEDYGPTLSFDDQTLLFGTKRNRRMIQNQEYINEDIYWAHRDANGNWGSAAPLEGINTQYNEGAPCLSKDGNTLYFVRCETPDGFGRCDIYVSHKKGDGTWTDAENLGVNVNTADWESHPSLSHSEDTLYFTSDQPGGFGSNDIYFTYKGKGGKWMPSQNLGPIINTKGNDLSPFYHPVYNILYFSSTNQPLNFGNFDIYKSVNVNGAWQEPKNIGPLVNGWGDEHFFSIDSKSDRLYYARSQADDFQQVDLYSFPLPMGAQPLANTSFSGMIIDSVTGKPFEGIVSIIDLDNGIEVAPKYVRPDGSFEFDLIGENKYLLVIQGEDFFRIEQVIDLNGDTTLTIRTPTIDFERIQFESIEFASNSSEITAAMVPDLTKLMDYLLDNPTINLVISGHTDTKGHAQTNIDLSQDRADAIRTYLISTGGLKPDRIKAIGYGSTKPIILKEETEEDRRINRRVEFEIIRTDASDSNSNAAGINN